MIFEGSRYERSKVLRVQDSKGVFHPTLYTDLQVDSSKFIRHTVIAGDRMDSLAFYYYRNAELWWFIAEANPEVFYPDDLVPGSVLRIPGG